MFSNECSFRSDLPLKRRRINQMVGKHSFCLRTNENSSNEKGPKTIQGFGDGEQNVSYKEGNIQSIG